MGTITICAVLVILAILIAKFNEPLGALVVVVLLLYGLYQVASLFGFTGAVIAITALIILGVSSK